VFAAQSRHAKADAAATRVALEFTAPAQCGSAPAFWDALETRSRRLLRADAERADVLVRVEITREGQRVVGNLQLWSGGVPTEPRKMRAAGCDELIDALALTVALSVDPEANVTSTGKRADAGKSADATTETASTTGDARNQPRPATSPTQAEAEQTADIYDLPPGRPIRLRPSVGLAPSLSLPVNLVPALGGRLFVGLGAQDGTSSAVAIGIGYISSAPLDDDLAMSYDLLFGEIDGCLDYLLSSKWTLVTCVSLQLGQLHASGQGLDNTADTRRFWLAPGLQLRADYALSSTLSAGVELSGSVPVEPQAYSTGTPPREIAHTPWVVPGATLRVEWFQQPRSRRADISR
jgi:hypothetical protein